MKKLFISQPMRDKTYTEILAERNRAIHLAKNAVGDDVEVIDSFFQGAPVGANAMWYLAKAIELLSTADVAYFAPGWDGARGCKIEYQCAVEYGVHTITDNKEETT